jgi:hypothetical protein
LQIILRISKETYDKRVDAILPILLDAGVRDALKNYTNNIYYLNKQYNTGTSKLNNWLKANGYTFKVNKVMLSNLHTGKRSYLQVMMLYIYTMYFNKAFNLNMQPFELVTYNFELLNLYSNPLRKIDKRYNKTKRTI